MKQMLAILGALMGAVAFGRDGIARDSAKESDLLPGLRAGHPRLLATSDDWARIRRQREEDDVLGRVHATLLTDARSFAALPPLEYKVVGRRLLNVSRALVQRLLTLGYAWQATRDPVFAQAAEKEMLAVAEFPDWNPSHFLDVGEAAAAVALGYDWCYDALSEKSRGSIRRALVEMALRPGLDPAAPHNRWHQTDNNWSQVCFGGLTLAALAIAEDEPQLARDLLDVARRQIRHGLLPYAPDGAYPEGPSYWVYGTTYQAMMIAALESALGTDWNLAESEGFMASAGAFLQTTGPTGAFFNHGDGGEQPRHEAVLYWFARKTSDPALLTFNRRQLAGEELSPAFDGRSWLFPLTAIWWPSEPLRDAVPKLPLRWHGRGVNPIVVFRESWTDPRSLYLACKGGAAELNHAHMDAGGFVLERDGVRWVVDLGAQDYYSLESKGVDLWNRAQDSQRWQVYRLNNYSHSTLTIDGGLHRVDGHAAIMEFSDSESGALATVDLSPVFRGQAQRVRRTFRWLPGRRVAIEDELQGLAPGAQVRWQVPTRAEIELRGETAVLRQAGHQLAVRLDYRGEAPFTKQEAAPPNDGFNAPNPGVSLLAATFTAPADGALRYTVVFGGEEDAR